MKVVHLDHAASFHPLLSMVQCFPFPDDNRVLARCNTYFHVVSQSPRKIQSLSLDPTIMSISSSNISDLFPPSDCNSTNEAIQYIRLGLIQEDVENGWRQDETLANSDSCLKAFKCRACLLRWDITALVLLL